MYVEEYPENVQAAELFINNKKRYCLWLEGASTAELRAMPLVMERIGACRAMRMKSTKAATRESSAEPTLFQERRQPLAAYIVVPKVSSENRQYIPTGFIGAEIIATDLLFIIPDASLYHFGILASMMHNARVRAVAGRLEMRYRYSNKIVYNNFPWPETMKEQKAAVGKLAQAVLDARDLYPESSLADLYDPRTMPPELAQAHRKLDAAVEKLYRKETFADDADRVAFLFGLYQKQLRGTA